MPEHTIRCREIAEADVAAVANLLTRGFANRSRDYWMRGLQRQASREIPNGYPRFGFLLESDDVAVGVLLLLYTSRLHGGETIIHCNLSSWYVEPAFRSYAPLLAKIAQRNNEVIYFNISPAPWTWPTIEAQGFSCYCSGLFFSIPALSRAPRGMTVETIPAESRAIENVPATEAELLIRHAQYGCLSLVCRTDDGRAFPFVLLPMRIRQGTIAPPAMQLIYCRDVSEYVLCAGAIGRALIRRRKIAVVLDSNGAISGLKGIFSTVRGRKYYKGRQQPRLADLSDTELVLYGP